MKDWGMRRMKQSGDFTEGGVRTSISLVKEYSKKGRVRRRSENPSPPKVQLRGLYTRGFRYCRTCRKRTKELVCSVCHRKTSGRARHRRSASRQEKKKMKH